MKDRFFVCYEKVNCLMFLRLVVAFQYNLKLLINKLRHKNKGVLLQKKVWSFLTMHALYLTRPIRRKMLIRFKGPHYQIISRPLHSKLKYILLQVRIR